MVHEKVHEVIMEPQTWHEVADGGTQVVVDVADRQHGAGGSVHT